MSSDSAHPMPLAQEAPLVEVIDSTSPATTLEVRRRRHDATDADNTAQDAAADAAVEAADEGDATEGAPQEYHGRGGLQTAVHQKVISQKVKAANTRTELQMEERQLREKLMLVQENLRRKEQQQQQHQQQREREEAAGYLTSAYATDNLPAFPRVHDATSTVDGSAAAASSASPKQVRGRLATPTRTHDPYATSGHISETEIDPTTALSLSGSHNVHPRGTSPVVAGAHAYPASYSPHPQQQVSHHHQRSSSQQFVAVRQQSFDGVDADVMPPAPAVGAAAVMGPAAPLPRGSVGVRPQRSSRASSVGSHHDGSQPDVDASAAMAQQTNAGQNAFPSPALLPLQCDAIQASGELPPRPASSTPRRNPYSSGTPNQNSRRGTPTARRVSPLQRRPPSPSAFAQAQLMNYDSPSAHSAHSATAAVGDAKPHNDSARGSNCSTPAAAAAIAAQLATSQQSHDGSAQAMDDGEFRRHNSHPEYDAYFHGDAEAEGAYHDQHEPVDLAITAAPSAVYPAHQQQHDQAYHHHMQDQMMTPPPPPFTQTDAALGHQQQEEPIESPLVGPGNNGSFSKMAAQISPRSAALEERSPGASSGARTPYAGAIDANGSVGSHGQVQGGQGGQSSQQGGARPAAGWPCVHRRSASSAGSAAGSYASYQHEPYATANMDPSTAHPSQAQPSAQVMAENSGAGGAFAAPHHRRGQSAGQRSTMSQGSGATGDRSPYAPSALNPSALTTGSAQLHSGPHSGIQSAQHSGQWHPSQQQHQQQYHPYEQPMDASEQAGAGHGQQSSRGSTPRPRTLYEMPTYADPGSALGTPMGQPGQGQPGFGDQPSGHTPRLQRTSSSGHAQRMQSQQGQQGQYQYQQSQHSQPFSSSTSSSQQASRRQQQHQQQQGGGYNDAYAYDVSFHVHPGTHHQRHGSQSQGSQQGSQRNSQQMQPSSQAQQQGQQGQQVQHRHTMSDSFSLPSRVAQTALSASSCDAPLDSSKAQGAAVLPPPIDVESSAAAAVGSVAVVTPSGVSPKPARKTVQVPAFEELDEVMQTAVQSVEQFVSFCKDCQWTKPHIAGDAFPAHRCECGQPVHLRCLVCDRVGRERRQWDQHVIGKKHLEARYLAAVALTEGSNPTTTNPTPTAASAPAAMAQNTTNNNNNSGNSNVAGVQGGSSHAVIVGGGGEQSARSPPPQQFQQQQQPQQPQQQQYQHYEQQQFVQVQQPMQQAPQFAPQIGQMGYGSTTPPSGQAAAALPVHMTAVAALGGFVPQGPAAGAPQMYAQPPQNFQQYAM